jgi:hypothetical protein
MKKKHTTALFAMVIMVMLAVFIGLFSSTKKLYSETERYYTYDETGFSIEYSIFTRMDTANNLAKIASEYAEEDAEIEILVKDLTEHMYFSTIKEAVQRNRILDDNAGKLFDKLKNINMSAEDNESVNKLLMQMQSEQAKINKSNFNDKAIEFNKVLNTYPAKFFKGMGGIEELPDFRIQ